MITMPRAVPAGMPDRTGIVIALLIRFRIETRY